MFLSARGGDHETLLALSLFVERFRKQMGIASKKMS